MNYEIIRTKPDKRCENYKTMLREIKEHLKKWEGSAVFLDQKTQYCYHYSLNFSYIQCNPSAFFNRDLGVDSKILKVIQ